MDRLINELIKKTGLFLIVLLTIFLLLGLAVLVGMRAEVVTLVNQIFAGTVKLIEVIELLVKTWEKLVEYFKELLLFVSPALAALTGFVSYITLMAFYKYVGQSFDVTLLTVILTIALSITPALLWPTKKRRNEVSHSPQTFFEVWCGKMSLYMLNVYELVLFAFFLTLDWETPFFLPQSLWGSMRATLGDTNLMTRGFNYHDAFIFTLWLAGLAVFVEVLRQVVRIVVRAQNLQKTSYGLNNNNRIEAQLASFRERLGESFNNSLDDLVRFLGYTTLVVSVFFLFPRLKLLSLVIFSFTTLVWDLLHQERFLVERENKDILSLVADKIIDSRLHTRGSI